MIVAESTGILDEKNARVLLILEERHGRGDRVDREKFDLARRMLIVLSVVLIWWICVELDRSDRRLLKTKRWGLGKGLNNQLIS